MLIAFLRKQRSRQAFSYEKNPFITEVISGQARFVAEKANNSY